MKRILLMDDQEDIRLLLRLAVEPLGYALSIATNGGEALELAGALQPDVAILDVMVPAGPNGFDVCRALRADPANAGMLIIMLSACGQQSDLEEGRRAGADHYMLKPFSPVELCDLIARGRAGSA